MDEPKTEHAPWWNSWAYFIGPCVHGRDPYTRCDVCAENPRLARALSECAAKLAAHVHQAEVDAILTRCGIPDDEEHEAPPPGTDISTRPA